jgi:hypothetical protein
VRVLEGANVRRDRLRCVVQPFGRQLPRMDKPNGAFGLTGMVDGEIDGCARRGRVVNTHDYLT